jgi:hypothetical protein
MGVDTGSYPEAVASILNLRTLLPVNLKFGSTPTVALP